MYLLDTHVLSELRKVQHRRTDRCFAAWAQSVVPTSLYVSVITLHELELGILRVIDRDPRQGKALRYWMTNVLAVFGPRTLDVDTSVSIQCAQILSGRTRPFADALIAATARVHGLIVVTRNTADFEDTGVSLLDPWS